MKSGSEKGWSNIQNYWKEITTGQDGQPPEEGVASRGEEEEPEKEEEVEDLMKHDISDLLGAGPEERGEGGEEDRPREGKRKKKKSKKSRHSREEIVEPPLISFDDEPVTPIPQQHTMEGSHSKTKAKHSGSGYGSTGNGSMGYGSAGYGSTSGTNSSKKKTEKASDWSGDWGVEWGLEDNTTTTTTTTETSAGSKSSGWDDSDWNTDGDGWSTVDLKRD